MPISQGNGLDVSIAGVTTPRPVNPIAAQNISTTNQSATQVTNDISLGSVSEAMSEATKSVESTVVEDQNDVEKEESQKIDENKDDSRNAKDAETDQINSSDTQSDKDSQNSIIDIEKSEERNLLMKIKRKTGKCFPMKKF